jgi:DNA-binding beta-propeller fold protein YncE
MVADSSRGLLYITDGDRVDRYNLLSGNFLSPFILGGSLMGIDISPDNNTLVVADQSYNSNYWVDVVDLTTGNSRQAKFPAPLQGVGRSHLVMTVRC